MTRKADHSEGRRGLFHVNVSNYPKERNAHFCFWEAGFGKWAKQCKRSDMMSIPDQRDSSSQLVSELGARGIAAGIPLALAFCKFLKLSNTTKDCSFLRPCRLTDLYWRHNFRLLSLIALSTQLSQHISIALLSTCSPHSSGTLLSSFAPSLNLENWRVKKHQYWFRDLTHWLQQQRKTGILSFRNAEWLFLLRKELGKGKWKTYVSNLFKKSATNNVSFINLQLKYSCHCNLRHNSKSYFRWRYIHF